MFFKVQNKSVEIRINKCVFQGNYCLKHVVSPPFKVYSNSDLVTTSIKIIMHITWYYNKTKVLRIY